MANDAKNEKKPTIDNDFVDEESNGKFILFIVLSILVVLGLIIGSVYYFNRDTEEPKEENNNPVEIIETPDLDEEEQTEPIEEEEEETYPVFEETVADNKPVQEKPVETPAEEPVEITYTIKFVNELNEQIGEIQQVTDLKDVIEPIVPEKVGYKGTWVSMCDNETNVCIYSPKYEKIIVTMAEEANYDIDLNGNVIEATGLVIENGRPETDFAETGFRSYIKIKFIAPDDITKEMIEKMTLSVTTEGVEGAVTENGIAVLDSTQEEIENGEFYFNYTVAVDEKNQSLPEFTIDWGNGTETKYTLDISGIEIQSYAEYIGVTKPTIEDANSEGVLTGAGDVTYDINASLDETDDNKTNITIEGEVNNYEEKTGIMEIIGLDEFNNIVTIKFTAPEGITDFSNLKVMTNPNTYEGPGILDGENYFYMYQAVDPGTTDNPEIIIDWDGDEGELKPETYVINTDTIKLTPTKEIDNTVTSNEENTYEQNLVQNHNGENIIEVTGEINYDEEKEGYLIETTFKPIEGTVVNKDNITVTDKDGNNIYNEENLVTDSEGNISYTHTEQVENNTDAPSITIDWNGENTVGGDITYNYDVSNVDLIQTDITN